MASRNLALLAAAFAWIRCISADVDPCFKASCEAVSASDEAPRRTDIRGWMAFSGVLFVVDNMPPNLRDIALWNPITHAITYFRIGYRS